jgi:hypothetical protein
LLNKLLIERFSLLFVSLLKLNGPDLFNILTGIYPIYIKIRSYFLVLELLCVVLE